MRELLKPFLIGGLVVGAALGLTALRFHDSVRAALADFSAPFHPNTAPASDVGGNSLYNHSKRQLIQRIQELDRTIAEQRQEMRRLELAVEQAREAAALEELALPPSYRAVVGVVTNRDPASGGFRLRINVGLADGLKVGHPVLANACLLGRIVEVSDHSATVLTIRDPNCRISVELMNRALFGILTGDAKKQWKQSGTCVVRYLPRDIDIALGEGVITSELGRAIPPGIPVGTIVANDQGEALDTYDNLYSIVRVRPAYSSSAFRVVVVLVSSEDPTASAP